MQHTDQSPETLSWERNQVIVWEATGARGARWRIVQRAEPQGGATFFLMRGDGLDEVFTSLQAAMLMAECRERAGGPRRPFKVYQGSNISVLPCRE